MTTVADQLEAAGVELDGQAPVLVRWSVRCRTETCRFALLHLRAQARARRAAAVHVEVHAEHDVVVSAEPLIPLGPEDAGAGRVGPGRPTAASQAAAGLPGAAGGATALSRRRNVDLCTREVRR